MLCSRWNAKRKNREYTTAKGRLLKGKNVLIKENLVIIFKITVYLHVPKSMYQKGSSDRSHVLHLNFEKPSAIIKTIYSKSNLRGINIILWNDTLTR